MVVFQSSKELIAYDLEDGQTCWSINAKDMATMASPTCSSQGFIISPGSTFTVWQPNTHPQPRPAWQTTRLKLGYCTPVAYEQQIYTLTDNGILSCWQEADGKQTWQLRLKGPFAASPVLIDGKLYALNEEGLVHVVQPGADAKVIATNKLPGTNFLATPAVANGALFLRSDDWLYCIAKP
jgi:outer membrane protein assembly factor BamB